MSATEASPAAPPDTSRISFTAHYTAYTWYRHGLSHDTLRTRTGAALFHGLRPLMAAVRPATGGTDLQTFLLQRHHILDDRLAVAIERHGVGQVVELAAGLSPRAYTFTHRYAERGLRYVETDLPAMVARKRARYAAAGLDLPNHAIVPLNILADAGPDSLPGVVATELDPSVPTAIISEGLINYFDTPTVVGLWTRVARTLAAGAGGVYLSDLHTDLAGGAPAQAFMRVFKGLLGVATRGASHLHFASPAGAESALRDAGFDPAVVHLPEQHWDRLPIPRQSGPSIVRVVEGWADRREA